ncbi:MAG: phosphotransferase family protein [Ferruginibacter sp.]|nr:phosphotransferase family protein [Cytophagales bacterium]
MLDQAQSVRTGEELDASRLRPYLTDQLNENGELEIQQFPGGFSNLTYLIRFGGQEYVLRRPPLGANVKSGHDMEREFRVLSALVKAFPKAPRPVAYCGNASVLGAPFYLMERVRGVILRPEDVRHPAGHPAGHNPALTPGVMRRLSEKLIDSLAEIHAVDLEATGLNAMGKPVGYAQRQVEGWTKRYRAAQTDDIAAMDTIADWLCTHLPPERYVSFLHNDFKYDNVVLNPDLTEITAILDWELSTVGDPLMDLGTCLSYWVEATDPEPMRLFGLTALPGNFTRGQVAEYYAARSGREIKDLLFYYAYGLFKTAVIIQQIYARYRKGLTQDARFAPLIHLLRAFAATAEKALEKGRIDRLG